MLEYIQNFFGSFCGPFTVNFDVMTFIWFAFAAMGLTHLVVDSNFFSPIRKLFDKILPASVAAGIHCHQCSGTWCGFLLGFLLISHDWPIWFFVCGPIGSWMGTFSKFFTAYLEAKAILALSDYELEDNK